MMSEERWASVERAVEAFAEHHYPRGDAKRDTEFNTMWYLAERDGAEKAIKGLMAFLESQAQQADRPDENER